MTPTFTIDEFDSQLALLKENNRRGEFIRQNIQRMLDDAFLGKIVKARRYNRVIEGKVASVKFTSDFSVTMKVTEKRTNGEWTKLSVATPRVKMLDIISVKAA